MSHILCLQENVNCKRTSYFGQNGFYQGTTATLGTATMENSMDVPYRRQPGSMSQLHHSRVWVNPTAAVFPEPTDGLMNTKRALSAGGRVLKGWRGCKRG